MFCMICLRKLDFCVLAGKHSLVLFSLIVRDDCKAFRMQMIAWKCLQKNYGRYIRQFQLRGNCVWNFPCNVRVLCQDAMPLYAEKRCQQLFPQIAFINSSGRIAAWADAGVEPVEQATELEWCRRVYLDLIGRIPTVDEVLQLQK